MGIKLTVICLDDDSFMLKAITRVLRRLRPDWNLYFYDDPLTWYDLWKKEGIDEFDIFISDLIMPGKRGNILLEEVKVLQPQAIRVLLTGDTNSDLPKIAHDYAHFVIPKPFVQESFEYLFLSAERLHKMPFTKECQRKLGCFTGLPVLPNCVTQLKEVLNTPDCDSQALANVISHEPALAAKLLQIANSPFFGYRRSTDSLAEVVTRLGITLIESVAISMLMYVSEDTVTKAQHQDIANLSLKSGSIARLLAKKMNRSVAEQDKVFIATLLTSVGALAILSKGVKKEDINEFLHFQDGHFDHLIVAAYILILWGYEIDLGEIILNQNCMIFDDHNDAYTLASIVGLASRLAVCSSENDRDELLSDLPDHICFLVLDNQSVLLDFLE